MKACKQTIVGVVFVSLISWINPTFAKEDDPKVIAQQIKKREADLNNYRKIESGLRDYLDPENHYFFLLDRSKNFVIPIEVVDQEQFLQEFSTVMHLTNMLAGKDGESEYDEKDLRFRLAEYKGELIQTHQDIQRKFVSDLEVTRSNISAVRMDIQRLREKEIQLTRKGTAPGRFPDAAGTLWEQEELGFKGTWERVPGSNKWKASWENGCDDSTIEITVTGNEITASRTDGKCKFSKGLTAKYSGTIQPDGTTIKGKSREITNSGTGDVKPAIHSKAGWSAKIIK